MKRILGALVALSSATPTKKPAPARVSTTQKPKEEKKACIKECGVDFKPICAGDGIAKNKSFGSACVLENHNCEMGTSKDFFFLYKTIN